MGYNGYGVHLAVHREYGAEAHRCSKEVALPPACSFGFLGPNKKVFQSYEGSGSSFFPPKMAAIFDTLRSHGQKSFHQPPAPAATSLEATCAKCVVS